MRTASRTFVERLIVFALLCSSFMVGCGDYSIKLPREYSLVRIYGGAFLIYHPDGKVAVDANVDGYKVYGTIVVGHVSAADLEPEKSYSRPGYFTINTETRAIDAGLSKQAFLDSLHKLGIDTEPALLKPARSQS
ncbi:MAG: hypothetical protein WBB60_00095 [Nitrospira sp.]|jgi:hypothetical protein|nr:hypothetical protein [Nitrospira sp.]HQY56972.1 hypothetical protein [Nitrospira sp.]HRA97262.1 hypothetical protein [Nitrospira sp.]